MKIALVATGGTIGSRKDTDGIIKLSRAATDQIASIVGADSVFDSLSTHSERMKLKDLNTFRRIMQDALATHPDGIIVTHGTDTLAFSSAYLAYAFCDTRIPIVICSSDLPLTERDSNGFDILHSAKVFLQNRKAGVFAVYKNPGYAPQVHHGARLLPAHLHEHFYHSLGDWSFNDTGLMHGMDFDLCGGKVLLINPYIGLDYSVFNIDGYAAIVQSGYHSGTVNYDDFNAFASKYPNIPMFMTAGRRKYDGPDFVPNIIQCHGITQTALYIKLLIAIKNTVKDLPSFVLKNACGEIVDPDKY
ncbi:MAG: asparaginase [Clostridiales bacterium]|nr:asparaginase [Clostridiales bacterium]